MIDANTTVNQLITTHDQIERAMTRFENVNDELFEEIISLSEFYGIDPGFVLATFALETGWGKSIAWTENNNPAGIKVNGEYVKYQSKLEGMHSLFRLTYHYTIGYTSWIGTRTTVKEIRDKWCGCNDESKIIEIWNSFLE